MNSKTTIVIALVTVLAAAICSVRGGFDKGIPYRQLLRELHKKRTGMHRQYDRDVGEISKREENCNAYLAPCSQYVCSMYTCEGVQLACNSAASPSRCEPGDSSSYR